MSLDQITDNICKDSYEKQNFFETIYQTRTGQFVIAMTVGAALMYAGCQYIAAHAASQEKSATIDNYSQK
ncbi:MAG: hypothetical protein AABX16_00995 [Nanoarchaeota archaeon]